MEPIPKFCFQLLVGSRVLELESVVGSSLLPFNASLLAASPHHEYQLVCLPASLEHAGWYLALLLFLVGAVFTLLICCIQQYYRTVHVKQQVERNTGFKTVSSRRRRDGAQWAAPLFSTSARGLALLRHR